MGGADSASIANCYNTGAISGKYAGGITGGGARDSIVNCYNSGSVLAEGPHARAGGIAAYRCV